MTLDKRIKELKEIYSGLSCENQNFATSILRSLKYAQEATLCQMKKEEKQKIS